MKSDPKKQDTEAPLTTPEETDVLDSVFENTERVCCGKSCGKQEAKKQDEATVIDSSPGDVEKGAADILPPTTPNCDTSTVKEAVEIEAHFDGEEEDGLTITSQIDHTSYAMNSDDTSKSFATQIRRHKLRVIFLFILLLVVAIVALSVGLSQKNNDTQPISSTNVAEVGSLDGDGQGSDSNEESKESNSSETSASNMVASPTPSPTTAPTACKASILVDKLCYNRFEDMIVATFRECKATSGAWVALYPEGSDLQFLEEPEFDWLYTCGTRNCLRPVEADSLELTRSLAVGTYQAVLISGENIVGPWAAIAVSEVFEVSSGGCA